MGVTGGPLKEEMPSARATPEPASIRIWRWGGTEDQRRILIKGRQPELWEGSPSKVGRWLGQPRLQYRGDGLLLKS